MHRWLIDKDEASHVLLLLQAPSESVGCTSREPKSAIALELAMFDHRCDVGEVIGKAVSGYRSRTQAAATKAERDNMPWEPGE